MRSAALLVGMFLVYGCPPSAPPDAGQVVIPPVAADAPIDRCSAACARLFQFDCPEGDSPDGGESCDQFCARASQYLDLDCILRTTQKSELSSCGVRCRR